MLVVDTNILVYAVDRASSRHETVHHWLDDLRRSSDAWYVTWPILFEFLRVITHANVLRRPWTITEAWSFVKALLMSPGLGILIPTSRHEAVTTDVFAEYTFLEGNILHDTHTAILMREHGIGRIATRDADFHRFKFIDVVDPLHP